MDTEQAATACAFFEVTWEKMTGEKLSLSLSIIDPESALRYAKRILDAPNSRAEVLEDQAGAVAWVREEVVAVLEVMSPDTASSSRSARRDHSTRAVRTSRNDCYSIPDVKSDNWVRGSWFCPWRLEGGWNEAGSFPSFGGGVTLWVAALLLTSIPREFARGFVSSGLSQRCFLSLGLDENSGARCSSRQRRSFLRVSVSRYHFVGWI